MSSIFVVGIDGSDDSKRAAEFAANSAKSAGAKLHVLYVLEWSPYEFLTPQELESRHARRQEELIRAESAVLQPAKDALSASGVDVVTAAKYGHVVDTLTDYCNEVGAEMIYIGRHGGSGLGTRIFGSVPSSLVQVSKIPITVVP